MKAPKRPNEKSKPDQMAEKRWEDEGGAPPDRPPASESEIEAAAQRVSDDDGRRNKGKPRSGRR